MQAPGITIDDFDYVGEVSDSLQCPICLSVFVDPIDLSPCHHTFCSRCVHLSADHMHDGPCPICRAPCESISTSSRSLRALLDELMVRRCPYERCSQQKDPLPRHLMVRHLTTHHREHVEGDDGDDDIDDDDDDSARLRVQVAALTQQVDDLKAFLFDRGGYSQISGGWGDTIDCVCVDQRLVLFCKKTMYVLDPRAQYKQDRYYKVRGFPQRTVVAMCKGPLNSLFAFTARGSVIEIRLGGIGGEEADVAVLEERVPEGFEMAVISATYAPNHGLFLLMKRGVIAFLSIPTLCGHVVGRMERQQDVKHITYHPSASELFVSSPSHVYSVGSVGAFEVQQVFRNDDAVFCGKPVVFDNELLFASKRGIHSVTKNSSVLRNFSNWGSCRCLVASGRSLIAIVNNMFRVLLY